MDQVADIVDAFNHADADRLAHANAALDAGSPLKPAAACLHAVILHRASAPVADALPQALVALLDRALATGSQDPDIRMALLAIAAQHALSRAAQAHQPIPERLLACEAPLLRARTLAPHCRLLRSRMVPHRLDTHLGLLGRLGGDHPQRRLRAAEAALADPEVHTDEDLYLEFLYHRLHARLDDHDLLEVEADVATVIAKDERYRTRLGFEPMWLQDLYWYLIGEYDKILNRPTEDDWQSFRTRHDTIHAYALIAAGHLDMVDQFLIKRRARLERSGIFARPHSNQAVAYHELCSALRLAQRRFDDARDGLRRCSARAEDPHAYLPLQLAQAAAVELADGNAQRARASLELLDTDGTHGDCLMAWCRLSLLEGNRDTAAQYFARARERTPPGYLEHQLRFAYELHPADALWLNRQQPNVRPRSDPRAEERAKEANTPLVGNSAAMEEVRRAIATFGPLRQTVLITGETGTGKECVARLLHEQGAHPEEPFLPLNCAALPDTLAESELFGHTRGAFTGADRDTPGLIAAANEGTVFLDEIASLSPRLQGVLLRVLETGDYRPVGGKRMRRRKARVVVASNRPLTEAVEAGDFRADLYYRLARFTIDVPPLRVRRDDIPQLCSHFVRLAGGAHLELGDALLSRLQQYDWPGNVRELRNEIERLVVLAPGRSRLDDDELFAHNLAPGSVATPIGPDRLQPIATDAATATAPIPGTARARQRRREILALLRQRGQLARSEVVDALGCAPSTATTDLKALAGCGLIERVETSAHLRTSYFVLATPADS